MDMKSALKSQYHAGLAMLRQCIDLCPEDVWLAGKHPRNTWRIAYHVVFYTHLYLAEDEASFVPWDRHRSSVRILWKERGGPPIEAPYTKADILEYLDFVDLGVDAWVDALDLESEDCGFSWYSVNKLEHQLVNLRHLGGHMGQLSELVMATGAEVDWVSAR